MLESEIKAKALKQVREAGGYATRIEDRYRVGFPDVIAILPGKPAVFAEFKVVAGLSFGPTNRQLLELDRIARPSPYVKTVVVGWKSGVYYVAEPKPICSIGSLQGDRDFAVALDRYLAAGEGQDAR